MDMFPDEVTASQPTAWFMLHRIREAWAGENGGPFDGPVEVDETYFGGKRKNMSKAKRKEIADTGRGTAGKTAVVGMKDRDSNKVTAQVVTDTDATTLQGFVTEHAAPDAKVYTDDAAAYKGMSFEHESVRHSVGEYVRDMAHTNGVESFWSMLKRAHKGTFHKISPKDPDIYEREQGCVFRGPTWSYLGLENEIPDLGDFKTSFLGDTPVVICRSGTGAVRAFVNRCAHRGTLLVREPTGTATDFTCIYHHWCYDLDGRLIGVPFLRGLKGKGGMPADFRMEDHGLKQLRVASRSGVIFASFDESAEDLDSYLGPVIGGFLDEMFTRPIEILGYMRQRTPGNWKLYFENLKDPYHAGLLHQFQTTFGLFRNTQSGGTVMDRRHRQAINHALYNSDDPESTAAGYGDLDILDESLT